MIYPLSGWSQIGKKVYKKPTKKRLFLKRFSWKRNKAFNQKETRDFLSLLAELLNNGFTLEKSLHFLITIMPKKKKDILIIKKRLLQGKALSDCLSILALTNAQKAQLSFAEVHGDLVGTLLRMVQHMEDKNKQQQHLIKLISYPCLLLFFLFGMVLGMKWYILPQLAGIYEESDSKNIGLILVDKSPLLIVSFILVATLLYLVLRQFLSTKSAVVKSNWLCQIPLLRQFLMSYYTSLFAMEWGKLLVQGMELREVVLVMNQKGYTPLMQEMATTIEKRVETGNPMSHIIKEWRFLKPEFHLIILQGEIKGDLGRELSIYGKREWQSLINLAEKKIRFLQPLLFLLIAILIISVYGALLLPIYKGMGDFY